jgi:hypothetical protein
LAKTSVERLEVVPGAVLCVTCSQKVGGEWEYSFKEVNTGKAGNLKMNYGGISIEKRRESAERLE